MNLKLDFLRDLDFYKYKVISIDFFDTFAFRITEEPDEIFKIIGSIQKKRNLINYPYNEFHFYNLRRNAQFSAYENLKYGECDPTLDEIYGNFSVMFKSAKKAIDTEYKFETKNLTVNQVLLQDLIQIKNKYDCDFVITSDTYFDEIFISDFINSKKIIPCNFFKSIFSSKSLKKSKREETIWKHIIKVYNCKPEQIIHIGDNKISDYSIPIKQGIKAIHFDIDSSINIPKYIVENNLLDNNLRVFGKKRKYFEYNSNCEATILGYTILGPYFVTFCHWVINLATNIKLKTLLVCMRDGYTLNKIITSLIDNRKYLESYDFYCSRGSLFFIKYKKINLSVLSKWTNLPITLKSLIDYFEVYLPRNLHRFSEILLTELNKDEKSMIHNYLLSLSDQLEVIIKQQRSLFLKYISSFNINKSVGIVDHSHNNTVSSCIQNIFDEEGKDIKVVSFITQGQTELFNGTSSRSKNVYSYTSISKVSDDYNSKIIKRHTIIEELLYGSFGSVKKYGSVNNKVVPILNNTDNNNLSELKMKTQKGIFLFLDYWKSLDFKFRNELINCEIIIESINLYLFRLLYFPTQTESNLFYKTSFDHGYNNSNNIFIKDCDYWPELKETINNPESPIINFFKHREIILKGYNFTNIFRNIINNNYTTIYLCGLGDAGYTFFNFIKSFRSNIVLVDKNPTLVTKRYPELHVDNYESIKKGINSLAVITSIINKVSISKKIVSIDNKINILNI
jgi:hypothetical protein